VAADGAQVWNKTAGVLAQQVSDTVWSSTFQEVRCVQLVDDVLVLAVPSQLVRQRIEQRYIALVEAALHDAGHPDLSVVLEVEIDDVRPEPEAIDGQGPPPDLAPTLEAEPRPQPVTSSAASSRRYIFESFVIGPSNRFAHAAALSVAETPARSYNPLFVYGGAGLGKTHLLQAIANYVVENYPHHRVRYISTETLLNEFVDAIRKNTQPDFKRRYREIDVLLVDDIQFILNRLRSRFKMGLITDIQPPDFETRLAILRKKGEHSGTRVPAEVLEFIALNITYNIRELEGALIRVSAYAALNDEHLTVDLAGQILADSISATKPRQITAGYIIERTAEMFGLQVEQLRGKSRTRDLVHARQVGMYVCRELTDLSYPQIGREFGGRDHTTVIHAYDKIANLMQERRKTYEDVTSLIQQINSGG
jgi:chromosomal replication initiator protein